MWWQDELARDEEGNPRLFTRLMKQECWRRAPPVPGRNPDRWRLDAAGNPVASTLRGCLGCLCHEYDHIVPFSRGGLTVPENCQILQTRVNRMKGNDGDDPVKQAGYSCARQWTEAELDLMEMAIWGDVKRDGLECRCKSKAEFDKVLSVAFKVPKKQAHLPDCP
jgi:hypothetical protein